MTAKLSVEEVLATLEARTVFHSEQEAFHAEREVHHRERRALHAAELARVKESLESFRALAPTALNLARERVGPAPSVNAPPDPAALEDLTATGRLPGSRLLRRVVANWDPRTVRAERHRRRGQSALPWPTQEAHRNQSRLQPPAPDARRRQAHRDGGGVPCGRSSIGRRARVSTSPAFRLSSLGALASSPASSVSSPGPAAVRQELVQLLEDHYQPRRGLCPQCGRATCTGWRSWSPCLMAECREGLRLEKPGLLAFSLRNSRGLEGVLSPLDLRYNAGNETAVGGSLGGRRLFLETSGKRNRSVARCFGHPGDRAEPLA
jgi:hypothetical protein